MRTCSSSRIFVDIESQVTYLLGLSCLNYLSAIQPVMEKLPQFICAKWEKEIAHYSDRNGEM